MALPSVACVQEEKPVQHRACGGGGSSRSNSSSSNISRKSRSDSKGQDKGPNGTVKRDFRVVEVPRNRWSCKRNQPWRSMKANIARFHRQTGEQKAGCVLITRKWKGVGQEPTGRALWPHGGQAAWIRSWLLQVRLKKGRRGLACQSRAGSCAAHATRGHPDPIYSCCRSTLARRQG